MGVGLHLSRWQVNERRSRWAGQVTAESLCQGTLPVWLRAGEFSILRRLHPVTPPLCNRGLSAMANCEEISHALPVLKNKTAIFLSFPGST